MNPQRSWEPYDCANCRRGGQWDDEKRATLRCSRVDLPKVEWKPDSEIRPELKLTPYMGRRRLPVLQDDPEYYGIPCNWEEPPEDPKDGCPAGWYRSPFATSLIRYMRRRDAQGNWSQNHLLDKADDLIVEMVHYYELEIERVESYRVKLVNQRREEELRKRDTAMKAKWGGHYL